MLISKPSNNDVELRSDMHDGAGTAGPGVSFVFTGRKKLTRGGSSLVDCLIVFICVRQTAHIQKGSGVFPAS